MFWLLGATVVVGVSIVLVAIASLPVRRFSYRMRRCLVGLQRAGRSMLRQPRAVQSALSLGIVIQLIFITLSIELAEACGLPLLFRSWVFAWPLAKLSAALPVTQGGIGVREAALAALLLPFGTPAALTVAAGLAWEAIMVSGALIGGLYAFLNGWVFNDGNG